LSSPFSRIDFIDPSVVEPMSLPRFAAASMRPGPYLHWHELLADPTIADAVLDRLVHTSHRIELDGPSLRDPKTGRRTEPASSATPTIAEPATKPAKGAKK
jgi:hypothetical protein